MGHPILTKKWIGDPFHKMDWGPICKNGSGTHFQKWICDPFHKMDLGPICKNGFGTHFTKWIGDPCPKTGFGTLTLPSPAPSVPFPPPAHNAVWQVWRDVLVLVAMLIGLRLLAYVLLAIKCRRTTLP